MTPKLINIVFPPGTGGNHIANLISLDKNYPVDIDTGVYDEMGGTRVHQTDPRENENVKIKLLHMSQFLRDLQQNQFDPNGTNILITLPNNSAGLAFQRIAHLEVSHGRQNNFAYHETSMMYSMFVVTRLTNLKWTVLVSDMIFRNDLTYLLATLKDVGINIDAEQAATYHDKWLRLIKKYVEDRNQLLHNT